jgi:hypothetical protein
MAETFQLEIVTPEKLVVKDIAEEAQILARMDTWVFCQATLR